MSGDSGRPPLHPISGGGASALGSDDRFSTQFHLAQNRRENDDPHSVNSQSTNHSTNDKGGANGSSADAVYETVTNRISLMFKVSESTNHTRHLHLISPDVMCDVCCV